MTVTARLERAADFTWRTARLLERLRFSHLFQGSSSQPVLAALQAYQNPDGGFGNALEPDLRAPASQPVPTWFALKILDEAGRFGEPMARRACDYLATITTQEGGVPFVLPSAEPYPRARWWQTQTAPPPSLLPTAGIAGLLYKNGLDHPWLASAADYCWRTLEALETISSYDALFALEFLEHAPDRDRAERVFQRLGKIIVDQGLVALEPCAPGEVHSPLDYAPRPSSLARRLFTDQVIEAQLGALAAAQQPDGGWLFTWREWNAATTLEWRGVVTIEALEVLRSYGRLES
jgi:hypothetical protein